MSRRKYLQLLAASAGLIAAGGTAAGQETTSMKPAERLIPKIPQFQSPPDHERRMKWWREAKFGMFIHWGLYSLLGRGEWVMAFDDIPVTEYEQLAKRFNPRPNVAREWARLAREAGMKYMVLTTKHHDGFCLFDTKMTDYCAPRQAAGRDLVREYVEAVRAEGLRVGFYFSLMDWHNADWMKCKTDKSARRRFVKFAHAQVRELMTNYGKIDELWFDGAYPLDAEGWRSKELLDMVLQLQPDIVINNRSWLAGDFSTPEQSLTAANRDWESCMTLNDHWGYAAADNNWKPAKTVIANLIRCIQEGGNYLSNIGPMPDGSVPEPCRHILESVGGWIQRNGPAVYGVKKAQVRFADPASFSLKGNTLYLYVHSWSGTTLTLGGIEQKPKKATLLASGQEVQFELKGTQLIFSGLPKMPPDDPITVITVEFESTPVQNSMATRLVDDFVALIHKQVQNGWG